MGKRSYLLHANILSPLVRQPQGPVAARIADVGERPFLARIIVASELRYGAAKRGSRKLTRQVEAVLGAMTILPLETGADRHHAAICTAFETRERQLAQMTC